MRMEQLGQSNQGKLGSAGYEREHAFAEETLTQSYSIQTSDQLVAFPYFYAGGQVLFVHADVSFNHFFSQPSSFLFDAELGTIPYHLFKRMVEGYLVFILVHQRAHGMGDMNLFRKDDKALQRATDKSPPMASRPSGSPQCGSGKASLFVSWKTMASELLENTQLIVFSRYRDVASLLQRAEQNLTHE